MCFLKVLYGDGYPTLNTGIQVLPPQEGVALTFCPLFSHLNPIVECYQIRLNDTAARTGLAIERTR